MIRRLAASVVLLAIPLACTATPPPVAVSRGPSAASTGSASGAASVSAMPPGTAVAPTPVVASPSASAVVEPVAPPAAPSGIAIGAGTRVFLFGDSMVNAGLGQRLERLIVDRGGTYAENHWSSSTTKKWSESERLPNLLFKHKPDVVFIALGSNEVYFLDKHAAEHVQAIVKKLDGRPCVWIGPPVWKTQTGIVDAERDNSSPCAFFDSSTVELERQKDGIHPSLKGGATWAEAVWSATVAPAK